MDVNTMDFRDYYKTKVMVELISFTTIDNKRKLCKDCGLPGHNNKRQLICPIRIKEDDEKKEKIKEHILNIDCLTNYDDKAILEQLASTLTISVHYCKKLYSEIQADIWINRKMNIKRYIDTINKCSCLNCNDVILEFPKNRIWRGKTFCDYCWDSRRGERELMWIEINEYNKVKCCICNKPKTCQGERFHYDHLNMFDKNDSICSMVDRGDDMKDIFSEIDRCQILCVSCHFLVTEIEKKKGFIRIKANMTGRVMN